MKRSFCLIRISIRYLQFKLDCMLYSAQHVRYLLAIKDGMVALTVVSRLQICLIDLGFLDDRERTYVCVHNLA